MQLEEGVSQASQRCCPLPVQCRALGSAGLWETCTPVPDVFDISLGYERKTDSERVSNQGAAWHTNKHAVFMTLTRCSACLGHISFLFMAGARLTRFVYFAPELHVRHVSVTHPGTNSGTPTFAIPSGWLPPFLSPSHSNSSFIYTSFLHCTVQPLLCSARSRI